MPEALSFGASIFAASDLTGWDFTSSGDLLWTSGFALALPISCWGSTFALSSVLDSVLAGSVFGGSLAIEGSSAPGGLPSLLRCFAESFRPSGPRSMSD
jgi:hypothetical protein